MSTTKWKCLEFEEMVTKRVVARATVVILLSFEVVQVTIQNVCDVLMAH